MSILKISLVLLGLVLSGCAGQTETLTPEESDLHVYYEELASDYEDLGRITATSRYDHQKDALKKILEGAAELGADGVIILFSGNQDGAYRIQATAMRYIH